MIHLHDQNISGNGFMKDISRLRSMLEFDAFTYKHSFNVACYSAEFIKYADCDIDASIVYLAGLFHDIGKTGINLDILNKKEILSQGEFELIRNHSALGFKILSGYEVPEEVLFAAQLHHERYDGSGYPFGLSGEEIPDIAKLISICDVFEALTADRPYREAYSCEQALDIMCSLKEGFDPKLLKTFMDNADVICQTAR